MARSIPFILLTVFVLLFHHHAGAQQSGDAPELQSLTFVQPSLQINPMLDDVMISGELMIGAQLRERFSFGLEIQFLLSEVQESDADTGRELSTMWYIGPTAQYFWYNSGRMDLFSGLTVGFGTSNYSESAVGLVTSGTGIFVIKPEIGMQYFLSETLHFNAGVGLVYLNLNDFDKAEFGAPSFRIGLRFGRRVRI